MFLQIWDIGRKIVVLSLLALIIIFGTSFTIRGFLSGEYDVFDIFMMLLVVCAASIALYFQYHKTNTKIKITQN